jgi:hypothetical protein
MGMSPSTEQHIQRHVLTSDEGMASSQRCVLAGCSCGPVSCYSTRWRSIISVECESAMKRQAVVQSIHFLQSDPRTPTLGPDLKGNEGNRTIGCQLFTPRTMTS